jgi:fumarylacetoacetase
MSTDATHDARLRCWLESAEDPATDFPIQNLPFGRFRRADDEDWRIGVAIGDQVLDLAHARVVDDSHDMGVVMALAPEARGALRQAISAGLRAGSMHEKAFREALVPQAEVEMGVPCEIGDYTDFYASIHHATSVGRQFRPDNPLLPNYKWVPIGYHGRVSSIAASAPGLGHVFRRPLGQMLPPGATSPVFGPSKRLDYELELGIFVGRGNPVGDAIPIEAAEDHVFGLAIFNDWTARDIQAWEYQPLGPFLSKNFASTLSPWMVTLEALAPFRVPYRRPGDDPAPLPYLDSQANRAHGAFDIEVEVQLQTARMAAEGHPGDVLTRATFADAYWTVAQLVTHHTVGGCNLRTGDLFGTGTLSGPDPKQGGSLLELSTGGRHPLALSNGETRGFLEDGDTVVMRASCQREGFRRIGFGECRGTVQPARG